MIYAHISIFNGFCLSQNNQKSCLIYIFHVNYLKLEKLTNVHQVKSKGVWRSIPQGIGGLHNHSVLDPDRGLAKETGVTSSFVVVRTLAHILLTAHEQNTCHHDHCNVTSVASPKKWIIGFSDESVSMYSHFYCTLLSYSMGLSIKCISHTQVCPVWNQSINPICVLSDWWFKISKEKTHT